MNKSSLTALKKGDHLYLIDGSGYLFRAYHALPPLTRRSDGLPIGAVSGYCNMLWKLLEDMKSDAPTHLAVIFDAGEKTFRNDFYKEYKAHRPPTPEDLVPQFSLVRDATRAFGVSCIEMKGFEADDLIATYARLGREAGAKVTIVSSDKDLMQLVVDGKVELLDTMKNKRIASAEVMERFGVGPDKVIDVQAIGGDSTDNVPGVKGIGVDTASALVQEFGSLENILALAESGKLETEASKRLAIVQKEIDAEAGLPIKIGSGGQLGKYLFEKCGLPGGKKDKKGEWTADSEIIRELAAKGNSFCSKVLRARTLSKAVSSFPDLIRENAENARISLRLVTLDDHVPLKEKPDEFAVHEPEPRELVAFLKAMELNSITKRVAARFQMEDIDGIAAAPSVAHVAEPRMEFAKAPPLPEADAIRAPINHDAYVTVTTPKELEAWVARAFARGTVCVDTETTSLDPMQANLCGVSLALAPGEACYIPCGHRRGDGLQLDGDKGDIPQMREADVLERLKPLLEDPAVLKVGQNLKYDALMFLQRGIRLHPIDDTMLISYVLESGLHGHGMDELSVLHLSHTPIAFSEVTGKGKEKINFDCVPVAEATKYSAEDADVTLRLHMFLKPKLAEARKLTVYETLERPLVMVLADMERAGVTINPDLLRRLSNDFGKTQGALEIEIHKLAGGEFNIGSPKQLGEILFDKMGLEGGRKTKTGAWSTDVDALEEVAAQGHEIAKKVLEWRGLAKLRGTYTDALPGYINPKTGRVHTSYAMASTSTGRLASTDPNLQNIPVRTEEGRRIRQAFIAAKSNKLISADYSQIELRLLAHIANIPELKKAFAENLDIHAMTASEIFGVPVKGMPAEIRRRAKAINFGIVYGISGFGLANQLGIPQSEASDYIKKYFARFPGIRDYMEDTKQFARTHGFVETLFGRRIHIREINSKIQGFRGGAERAAINAPIQGSAADVIRRAMIRLPGALADKKLSARMLLQVHDELIFEAPDKEVEATSKLVSSVMEKAALPAVEISVPLVVEARAADNWDAAH